MEWAGPGLWAIPIRPGYGAGGGAAGCVSVSPGGRMAFYCIRCEDTLKPFAGARAIRLWVRTTCEWAAAVEPPVYVGVSTRGEHNYTLGHSPDVGPCPGIPTPYQLNVPFINNLRCCAA